MCATCARPASIPPSRSASPTRRTCRNRLRCASSEIIKRQLQQPGERHIAGRATSTAAPAEAASKQTNDDEEDPPAAPVGFGPALSVEVAVEQADEPTDQPDRMR